MEITKNLSVESFNDFIRCLTNLKEVCNDADIREGFLRQRTNTQTSVFEIDLRPIFEDSTISLTNLKQKLELLKTFQGQEVSIDIYIPDVNGELGLYTFKDQYSSISFVSPSIDYMDNKFMTEEELSNIFPETEDGLIFEKELPQIITDRIRVVSQQFSIETVLVEFNGESSAISASTPSKDQSARFVNDIVMDIEVSSSFTNITNVAFSIDHETDIIFKMFKDPNQNVALNKFSTTIGDIDINVYSRSQIIQIDND
jgi:hypothetical protein